MRQGFRPGPSPARTGAPLTLSGTTEILVVVHDELRQLLELKPDEPYEPDPSVVCRSVFEIVNPEHLALNSGSGLLYSRL